MKIILHGDVSRCIYASDTNNKGSRKEKERNAEWDQWRRQLISRLVVQRKKETTKCKKRRELKNNVKDNNMEMIQMTQK